MKIQASIDATLFIKSRTRVAALRGPLSVRSIVREITMKRGTAPCNFTTRGLLNTRTQATYVSHNRSWSIRAIAEGLNDYHRSTGTKSCRRIQCSSVARSDTRPATKWRVCFVTGRQMFWKTDRIVLRDERPAGNVFATPTTVRCPCVLSAWKSRCNVARKMAVSGKSGSL